MRLIDADKIPYKDLSMGKRLCYAAFADDINRMPTIEERKKGKWLVCGDIPKTCPYCHEDWDKYVNGDVWYSDELPNYCPNCGADMRGEEG